jgi:hypothetical protein
MMCWLQQNGRLLGVPGQRWSRQGSRQGLQGPNAAVAKDVVCHAVACELVHPRGQDGKWLHGLVIPPLEEGGEGEADAAAQPRLEGGVFKVEDQEVEWVVEEEQVAAAGTEGMGGDEVGGEWG